LGMVWSDFKSNILYCCWSGSTTVASGVTKHAMFSLQLRKPMFHFPLWLTEKFFEFLEYVHRVSPVPFAIYHCSSSRNSSSFVRAKFPPTVSWFSYPIYLAYVNSICNRNSRRISVEVLFSCIKT
jgi:hypothetical protein